MATVVVFKKYKKYLRNSQLAFQESYLGMGMGTKLNSSGFFHTFFNIVPAKELETSVDINM